MPANRLLRIMKKLECLRSAGSGRDGGMYFSKS